MFKQPEETELTVEESTWIEALCEQQPFSAMEASKTALFTTIGFESGINAENEDYMIEKIKKDVYELLESGYTTFLVSRGNSYGKLALDVMIRMKEQIKDQWKEHQEEIQRDFAVHAVKLYGERQTLSEDKKTIAFKCVQHGIPMQNLFPLELIGMLKQISVISHEKGFIQTHVKTKKNAKKVVQLTEYLLSINKRNTLQP